nr:MAG TPA: tail tape measure protein [Caudoviricetes sp.]
MAKNKTEAIITLNGQQPLQVLKQLQEAAAGISDQIDAAQAKLKNLKPNTDPYKALDATIKDLKKQYDLLASAQIKDISANERLQSVVNQLSNTSLRNLRRALGDGKRQLEGLSEAEMEQANSIRAMMKEVGDEIRLLEGKYVKIKKGLKDVDEQSDQWLSKALTQQRELVSSLKKTDASYQSNLDTLKQLEAEEDRRKGKMSVWEATGIVNRKHASASDLRRAKTTLTEARDNTDLSDENKINSYNESLATIEKRLEAVSGKAQKASMDSITLLKILSNPNGHPAEDIKAAMDAIQKQIQKLPVGSQEVAKLRQQYAMLEKALKGTYLSHTQLNDVIERGRRGKASINELKQAYNQLSEELNQLNTKSKEFNEKQKELKDLKKNIDNATGSISQQSKSWQTAVKNLTAYVGLFQVFNAIKDTVTSAIKKNFEYSSSLTDIRKVSGLTMQDVNKLSEELAKIDTRTSVDGLAQLAYQGAKLGMGKYGVEGMKQFVAAADQINVAIGEEMGEEALPALSKMVETMGLIPKMGIEKAMLATGSAMFKLSSTSTSTSTNIVEFAKRLTGVSRTAGITTDQLLALGSASDSLFLMPEVSATAMSKFIVALQKNHNLIEKDLGIQQGTIKNMYAAGHAMDAIVLVLEKMRDKGNMNALGDIFKDVGSDGQRLITSMVTMSKNVDVLKDHLYESKEAFEEASAVTNEYKMQQQSAAGILDRANNLWEKAFVNPDGVESVKSMAEAWYDMSQMILQSPIFKNTLQAALWSVITACKVFITLLPLIANYVAALGIYKAVSFLWELGKALKAAAAAQTLFNSAAKVNPYVAIASAILTAVGVVWSFVSASEEAAAAEAEAARKANAWRKTLGEAAVETSNLNKKLDNYKRMMNEANLSQKERQGLVSRFNRDFRSYIANLGIEIKNVKDLRDHYSELAQEAQRATYYRMREKAKEQALPKFDSDRNAASNELMEKVRGLGLDKLGVSFQDIDRWVSKGASGTSVFWYLAKKLPKNKSGLISGENWKVDNKGFVYRQGYDGRKISPSSSDPQMAFKLRDLLSASRWYTNATHRRGNKEKEIDNAYANFVPEGYTPYPEESPGTLDNKAPDNDAIAAAKREARERKQALRDQQRSWRDELKQKQDEASAIMDNVRNFYERQINEKLSQAVSLGRDETEQKFYIEPIKRRMNEALAQVRLAIAGQANTWEEFKKTMDNDLVEKTDETGVNLSQNLLASIQKNNVDALREKMAQLGNSLNRPMNSITSEIFAKATKNQQNNITLEAQQAEARRKIAREHNYTGAVQQSMYDDFNQMGFANPTDFELADEERAEKRKEHIIAMYEQARKQIANLYTVDVSSKEGRGLLMQMLFGDDPYALGARIQNMLGDNAEDWHVFYNKLIQYSDEYTEAQKKTFDQAKKIAEQMWKVNQRNLANQETLRKMQQESALFGKRTNMWSNLGLGDLTADPEVELLKMKMQMAEDYYAFCEKNSRNKQLLDEADKARQEAELAYVNQMATAMKNRLSQMQQLVQPIETFGAEVGKAFAEMRNDVSSAQESIKNALKSMLESWANMALNDVNTQMWKAINDAGAKRAKKKAQPDIDKARANANANAVKEDFSNLGTKANPMYVRLVDEGAAYLTQQPQSSFENMSSRQQPIDWNPDGSPIMPGKSPIAPGNTPVVPYAPTDTKQGTQEQQNGAPHAWAHRNRDNANAFYQDAATQTGAAAADAIAGGGSWSDVAAGIGGSFIGGVMNTEFKTGGGKSKEDKEKAEQLKKEKKHQKELSKEVKKGNKDREKVTTQGVKNITDVTDAGNKEQTEGTKIALNTGMAMTETALTTNLAKTQANNEAVIESDADRTRAGMTFSIAGAIGKCFDFLGPIAGPIAAAGVMATLMGLLQWALNSAFSGGKKKSNTNTTNTKLVTGMLTYDSGNVQDLKPFVDDNGELYWMADDNDKEMGKKPFMADNSEVYWAKEDDGKQMQGVKMLTSPTATTVNGQPSLIAERGPEIVIGRETTHAMMMNNPGLLKALVNYDRNYSGRNSARRAFDNGNVGDVLAAGTQAGNGNLSSGASAADDLVSASIASNAALLQAVNALIQRLNEPINAKINMFGRGELYDSLNKANQFMKNK